MKKILLQITICLALGTVVFATAQVTEKCFSATWLQGIHNVIFEISGQDVSGQYDIINGEGEKKSYRFTGTLAGTRLTVKFADDKLPDIAPSEMKTTVWTLTGTGAREVLKIKVYGKNYRTNRYQTSFAQYPTCLKVGSRS
jgi:hypothetical protein